MDRSRHICGVAAFDRILWDRAPRVAHAYPTREGSGVVLQARSPDSRSARIPEGDALVILAMRDAFHRYEEADIGGFAVDRSFTRGRFALIPPGCAGRWVSEGHPALLHIQLGPERLAELDDLAGDSLAYGVRANAHDPVIDRVATQLASELSAQNSLTTLAIDTLMLGLAVHLARHYSSRKSELRNAPARLAPWRAGRVIDFINAHLSETLSLEQLASEAGLSAGHFARCFKSTFGASPHRFVLERRVERAKDLLSDTATSIAEIALGCGFASQSHLTDCFRAMTRTTPGAWRRDAAGRATPEPATSPSGGGEDRPTANTLRSLS